MKSKPNINPDLLKIVAPSWEAMDKQLVREVKSNLMEASLTGSFHQSGDGTKFSLRALALLNARLPWSYVEKYLIWQDGDSYEDICRRRLLALEGVYPEW